MATNAAARREQAYRTAWRIIKDWVDAQMALLETEMVDFEEVFMPYILSGRETLYQPCPKDGLRRCQQRRERRPLTRH